MAKRKQSKSSFRHQLDALMKEHRLTVREVAKLAGVGSSTVTGWRSGASPTDFHAVQKLAGAFKVSMAFLLTGKDDGGDSAHNIAEVFGDGGMLFDGYAEIKIRRLIPRTAARKRDVSGGQDES